MLSEEQVKLNKLKNKSIAKPPYRKIDYFNQVESNQSTGVQDFIRTYARSNSIQHLPYIIAGLLVAGFAAGFLIYIILSILPDAQNTFQPVSFEFIIIYWIIVGVFILLGLVSQWFGSRRWFLLFESSREITTAQYAVITTLRQKEAVFDQLFKAQKLTNMITHKQYALLLLQYLDGVVHNELKRRHKAEITELEAQIKQHVKARAAALLAIDTNANPVITTSKNKGKGKGECK